MSKRKAAFLGSSLAFVAIVIVITVVLNLIVGQLPSNAARFDCTEYQEYTMSKATKKIFSQLQDIVTITYYVSKELPGQLELMRQDTVDFLNELKNVAPAGKLEIRVVDPEDEARRLAKEKIERDKKADAKSKAEGHKVKEKDIAGPDAAKEGEDEEESEFENQLRKLQQAEITRFPVQSLKQHKFEEELVYSAIEIRYLDRGREILPRHHQLENLEYDLSRLVLKAIKGEDKPVVAFFDGQPKDAPRPEPPPELQTPGMNPLQRMVLQQRYQQQIQQWQAVVNPYGGFKQQILGEFLDVKDTKLTEEDPIPADAQAIVIAQPKDLNERQVYEINHFISSGGKAVFFVGNYTADLSSPFGSVTKLTSGLEDLLRSWGIRMNAQPVNSEDCQMEVEFMLGRGQRRVRPTWCHVVAGIEEFDQQSPFLRDPRLRVLTLPWTVALDIIDEPEALKKKDLTADVLVTSSEKTWFGKQNPTTIMDIFGDTPYGRLGKRVEDFSYSEPQNLVILLSGTFPFLWQDKNVPAWPEKQDEEEEGNGDDETKADTKSDKQTETAKLEEPKESFVLLIGSPDFCKDKYATSASTARFYSGNYPFISDVLEAFTIGNELVKIKAKQSTRRPFDSSVKEGTMTVLTWLNLLVMPLLVGAAGLCYALWRTRVSAAFERRFGLGSQKQEQTAR